MTTIQRMGHGDIDVTALGARIRELRVSRGMTQATVVGNDMSIAYLSRIEAGQRRPDTRLLEVIAKRLGTTTEELLGQPSRREIDAVQLELRLAELTLSSGEPAEAAARLEALLGAEPPIPPSLRPAALWSLASARETLGEYAEAIRLLEQLAARDDGPHPALVGVALSRCYREAGDLSRAIEVARAAQGAVEWQGLGDSVEAVQLLVTMAAAYHERGDVVVARNLCVDAVDRAERMGSLEARASAYWNASIIARRAGEPEALSLAERALALFSELDDGRRMAQMRLQVGILLVSSPEPDVARAEKELRKARKGLAAASAPAASLSRCDQALAKAMLAAGDLDEAWTTALRAREGAMEAPLALAAAEATLGKICLARRQKAEGRRRFMAAVAALTGAAADREAAQLWFELGTLLDEAGETEAARDAFRSAAAASGLRLPASTLSVPVH